jgi:hypothetical protein
MKRLRRLDFCAPPAAEPQHGRRIAIGALLLGLGAGLIRLLWPRLN